MRNAGQRVIRLALEQHLRNFPGFINLTQFDMRCHPGGQHGDRKWAAARDVAFPSFDRLVVTLRDEARPSQRIKVGAGNVLWIEPKRRKRGVAGLLAVIRPRQALA